MPIGLITLLIAAATFALQSFLFQKCTRTIFHLIPVILIGCVYLSALGLFLADILLPSGGYRFYAAMSFLITGVNTVALIADGVAWLIEKV